MKKVKLHFDVIRRLINDSPLMLYLLIVFLVMDRHHTSASAPGYAWSFSFWVNICAIGAFVLGSFAQVIKIVVAWHNYRLELLRLEYLANSVKIVHDATDEETDDHV